MKAALLMCALLLVACDTNECGSVDLRYTSITGPLEITVDCPGDQDISPGNTFDAEGTVKGLGLRAAEAPRTSASHTVATRHLEGLESASELDDDPEADSGDLALRMGVESWP